MPQYEGGSKSLKILLFADSTGQSSKMQYNHKKWPPVLPEKTVCYNYPKNSFFAYL